MIIATKNETTKGAGSTGTRITTAIFSATGFPEKGPGSWPSTVTLPDGFREVDENFVFPRLDREEHIKKVRRRVEDCLRKETNASVIWALATLLGVKTE